MITEFDQKKHKCAAIILPTVDSIHEMALTADCSYDTQGSETLHSSDHVVFSRIAPSMLPLISLVDHALIYVDDDFALGHVLYIVSRC